MKIFKKIILEIILVFVVIFISGCDFVTIEPPPSDKYYGPKYGYAEEYGDVEVVLREDGYYQVVDFAESAKQNNVLIIPDNINGIPVVGVGLNDEYHGTRVKYDILFDDSIVSGIGATKSVFVDFEHITFIDFNYEKFQKNLIRLDELTNYIYYYEYPQFNNTAELDSLYISSYGITNFLPLLFLKFSNNSKIVFNLSVDNPTFSGQLIPYYLDILIRLINFYDGSEYKNKKLYMFSFDNFKPKIIVNKADYFAYDILIKNVLPNSNHYNNVNYPDNYLKFQSILQPANVSFKYNLPKEETQNYNFKVSNDYITMLSENSENSRYVDKWSCDSSEYFKLVETDNYWIDYNMDGDLLMEPPTPYLKGYEFLGWYKDAECTEKWSFDTDKVSFENDDAEIILYAKWNENKEE